MQEIEHLKMAVAKVEAHRPNVLLVEKSVSSYAQKYLLEKEISFVLNVKRPLLERIAKCTGANISPSIDSIASARLGQCEIFRLEKVSENHPGDPLKKKKTLMFFEGCPRRLGCTVILRGTCLEELKKVKHVVQYASFAAYHLLLETSFLADEGATFPRTQLKTPYSASERATTLDNTTSTVPGSDICNPRPPKIDDTSRANGEHDGPEMTCSFPSQDALDMPDGREGINCELEIRESFSGCLSSVQLRSLHPSPACTQDSVSCNTLISDVENNAKHEVTENILQEEGISGYDRQPRVLYEKENTAVFDNNLIPGECFSNDNHQSILVSLSSRCVLKGIVCQRAQLLRIKFYGSFDKPLGRYLRDDLFDQAWCCDSCQEPVEAHVKCYTHQHGSVTINVRRLPSLKLPGECEGRIWMWHRCLKCTHEDGVPPATRRVVMSNAARGLSFGKFLELSFSNHATANRIASCGHSLQRDCLRFYGFGSMVAFFRYSPTDILSVHLPPSLLKFNSHKEEEWVMKELTEISNKMNSLYAEIFDALHSLDQKSATASYESSKATDFHDTIMELKDLLKNERNKYEGLLQPVAIKYWEPVQSTMDILELNRLRLSLLIDSHIWSHRLYLVDSSLKSKTLMSKLDLFFLDSAANKMQDLNGSFGDDGKLEYPSDEASALSLTSCGDSKIRSLLKELEEFDISTSEGNASKPLRMASYTWSVEGYVNPENFDLDSTNLHKSEGLIENTSMMVLPSPASNLSDKIDSAWTGMAPLSKTEFVHEKLMSGHETNSAGLFLNHMGHPHHKKIMSPIRVYSFDSAPKQEERDQRGFPSASLHLSSVKSFDFRGGLGTSSINLISKMRRAYSETSSIETQNLISSSSHILRDGARLLLPQGHKNLVITVHDNEPSSVICYALSSKEYVDFVTCRVDMHPRRKENQGNKEKHTGSPSISSVQESNSLLDLDGILYRYNGSGKVLSSKGTLIPELKETHFRVAFDDETSFHAARSQFSVTCYFAKQFDALRKKCCPNEIDFIRSLSRCRKWGAQGGKSNVYFAKSLDERFIIKQVTKTELESFEEFSTEYFKYVTETINSGSPTCLAKILGVYQVTVKHLKGGGREVKMDLMVMENLFYKRSISRIYDLKGSSRSRYNSDTTGNNKVMLDVNLLETLRTKPIFLGTKAKRRLERAVWNDTSFLASVDVMDYSLLVGLDEERKELIIGIIDFMRQYTWDKHLETWVKASGILGGPKNETPTIISPKQYKKRFRKAMSTYFLAVPDQWPS
ncbi:putative 1-phosphatidylinositol-3-phosphate 5-kinase FAB1C [Acorus gramineus]|uniref:1-phosphatidylinositol-3-phosphate 5-kinase n=1 Tax=Acorus gramineus TaxID=55184 RepID=A0AAV9BMJ7_ACOGR|nr:putative 1-phosphatidylinositol-3-phosphate 5-kinase FAB1C [Acorus gramineus]